VIRNRIIRVDDATWERWLRAAEEDATDVDALIRHAMRVMLEPDAERVRLTANIHTLGRALGAIALKVEAAMHEVTERDAHISKDDGPSSGG
jgi:hypothetical protein